MPDLFDNGQERRPFDPYRFLEQLEELDRAIPSDPSPLPAGRPTRIGPRLLERIRGVVERLTDLARTIDPVRHFDVYDPSHPEAAAELIAEKLQRSERFSLREVMQFWGSGVYALYYRGDHPAYFAIARSDIPIYVGKAEPGVPNAVTAHQQGRTLERRLNEHARSIRRAEDHALGVAAEGEVREGLHPIRIADFDFRYLVLASPYAAAVESALIRHFQPVWNLETAVCVGFGKHGDAASTRANARSDWDTIHPGRPWATGENNIPNRRSMAEIQAAIIAHLTRMQATG